MAEVAAQQGFFPDTNPLSKENLKSGGFGSSILEFFSELKNLNNKPEISIMGIDDKFIEKYGTQQELLDFYGLSYKDISKKMKSVLK